jgi:hypothetical protein
MTKMGPIPAQNSKKECISMCGNAQISYLVTITLLHHKQQCHLPVSFALLQLFPCVASIIQTSRNAARHYLPSFTTKCHLMGDFSSQDMDTTQIVRA